MRARVLVATFLLILFLLFLPSSAAFAQDNVQQPGNAATVAPEFTVATPVVTDSVRQFAPLADETKQAAPGEPGQPVQIGTLPRWVFDRSLLSPGGPDCYTMRTYMVERVDKTDITRPAGYVDCVSSNKVQMKRGLEPNQK